MSRKESETTTSNLVHSFSIPLGSLFGFSWGFILQHLVYKTPLTMIFITFPLFKSFRYDVLIT